MMLAESHSTVQSSSASFHAPPPSGARRQTKIEEHQRNAQLLDLPTRNRQHLVLEQ